VKFAEGNRTVIDGPFPESKQLVAGYWILQVPSMEEAVEWARRAPFEALSRIYPGEYGATGEIELVATLSSSCEVVAEAVTVPAAPAPGMACGRTAAGRAIADVEVLLAVGAVAADVQDRGEVAHTSSRPRVRRCSELVHTRLAAVFGVEVESAARAAAEGLAQLVTGSEGNSALGLV
jgi:hypothetical protein